MIRDEINRSHYQRNIISKLILVYNKLNENEKFLALILGK